MSTVVAVVAVLLAVAALVGCVLLLRANARLRARQVELESLLDPDAAAALSAWDEAPPSAGREIVIVVHNVAELAAKENRAAIVLNRVRPSMVQRMVYDEMARQLRERLVEEDVEADVQVRFVP